MNKPEQEWGVGDGVGGEGGWGGGEVEKRKGGGGDSRQMENKTNKGGYIRHTQLDS
jgi:hypothetical protein